MKKGIIFVFLIFIILSNSVVALADQESEKLDETQVVKQLKQLEDKHGGKFTLLESNENTIFDFSSIQEVEDFISSIKEEVYVEDFSIKNDLSHQGMNIGLLSMKRPSVLTKTHVYYAPIPGTSVYFIVGKINDTVSINRSTNPNNYGYFLDIISHTVYTTDASGTYIEFYKTSYVTDGGRTLYSDFNGLYQLKISILGLPVGYNFDVSGYYEFGYSLPF